MDIKNMSNDLLLETYNFLMIKLIKIKTELSNRNIKYWR